MSFGRLLVSYDIIIISSKMIKLHTSVIGNIFELEDREQAQHEPHFIIPCVITKAFEKVKIVL